MSIIRNLSQIRNKTPSLNPLWLETRFILGFFSDCIECFASAPYILYFNVKTRYYNAVLRFSLVSIFWLFFFHLSIAHLVAWQRAERGNMTPSLFPPRKAIESASETSSAQTEKCNGRSAPVTGQI